MNPVTKTRIKKIARFIIGSSVGYTAGQVLLMNLPPQDKKLRRAEVAVGGIVIGAMASDAAGNWTDDTVDTIFDAWESRNTKEEIPEEIPAETV